MPALTPLGFVLSKDILLTVRIEHTKVFEDVLDNVRRRPMKRAARRLRRHFEVIVNNAADVLEGAGADLDGLSDDFSSTTPAPGATSRARMASNCASCCAKSDATAI